MVKIMRKLILIILSLILFTGCESQQFLEEIEQSPSGKYKIKVTINTDESDKAKYLCLKLHLLDTQNNELTNLQTGASHRMKWVVGWMPNDDIIVLYSSDIGTYAYKIEGNILKNIQTTDLVIKRGEELKKMKYMKP